MLNIWCWWELLPGWHWTESCLIHLFMYFQYCALPGKAGHRRSLSGLQKFMVVWFMILTCLCPFHEALFLRDGTPGNCWVAATTPMQVVLVGAGTLGITLLLSTLLYNSIWGGAAECRGLGVYSGICNLQNSYLYVHDMWHTVILDSWEKVKGLKPQKVLIILKALFPNIRILLSPVYYSFL